MEGGSVSICAWFLQALFWMGICHGGGEVSLMVEGTWVCYAGLDGSVRYLDCCCVFISWYRSSWNWCGLKHCDLIGGVHGTSSLRFCSWVVCLTNRRLLKRISVLSGRAADAIWRYDSGQQDRAMKWWGCSDGRECLCVSLIARITTASLISGRTGVEE